MLTGNVFSHETFPTLFVVLVGATAWELPGFSAAGAAARSAAQPRLPSRHGRRRAQCPSQRTRFSSLF